MEDVQNVEFSKIIKRLELRIDLITEFLRQHLNIKIIPPLKK